MKTKTILFYIIILIILTFLEYWAIVVSIFVFLGKRIGIKNNYYFAEIIFGLLDILFFILIIFTIIKFFNFLGKNSKKDTLG
jgi:hypothetical protein